MLNRKSSKLLAIGGGGLLVLAGLGLGLFHLPPAGAAGTLTNASVAKALSSGGAHSCAIFNEAGLVYCWGLNDNGQLGTGDTTSLSKPTTAVALGGLKAYDVAVGFQHSCVVAGAADGSGLKSVYCWGSGDKGQLGNGATADSSSPVLVGGALVGLDIARVYAGFSTTCAVSAAGASYCWGDNDEGQYGNGDKVSSNLPVATTGWANVSDLAIGMNHVCGIISGAVKCAGAGADGQLGDGQNDDSLAPVAVSGISGSAVAVSSGYFMSCAMTDDGGFYCWGDDTSGQLGSRPDTSKAVLLWDYGSNVPLDSGYAHTCAGATALCIGENGSGQLGDGTTANRDLLVNVVTSGVLAGQTVKQISAGFDFTCWVFGNATDGDQDTIYCTGAGVDGQLGNNTNQNSSVPVALDTSGIQDEATYVRLTLSAPALSILIAPGETKTGNVDTKVVTNNSLGYALTIQSATAQTGLGCSNASGNYYIETLSSAGGLVDNRYGFNAGTAEPTTWKAISASPVGLVPSTASATTSQGDDAKLWLGVKVNFQLPACRYQNDLVLSATANA